MKVGDLSDQILPDFHHKTVPMTMNQLFSSAIKPDLLMSIVATLFYFLKEIYNPTSVKRYSRKLFTLEK